MMPPSDPNPDPRPLLPEERALAQRLARLGPHGEPAPALDARILAAAHDAGTRTGAHRSRRRWPVAFGIAASLALAVGIAWQLRPLPDPTTGYRSEAPSAAPRMPPAATATAASAAIESAVVAEDMAARSRTADVAAPRPAPMPAPEPESPPVRPLRPAAEPESAPKASAPVAPASTPSAETARVATAVEPEIVSDAPSAATVAAQSATASQGPRAFGAQPPPAVPSANDQRMNAPPPSAGAETTALPNTDTLDRLQAKDTRDTVVSDEPDTDVPPATMASPQVRDAWLARIRELVAAGRIDAARVSLHEFMSRYPHYRVPDDLRALAP